MVKQRTLGSPDPLTGKSESSPLLGGDNPEAEQSKSWRLVLVCMSLFLYMFSFIGIYFMISQYSYFALQRQFFPNMTTTGNDSSGSNCVNKSVTKDQIELQQLGANLNIYVVLISIPSIFTNIVYGTYGDLVGRKVVFLITNSGSVIKAAAFFFIIYFELNIYYILIPATIESVMGGFVAMIQAASAYVADITAANKSRSFAIAMVELSLGIGTAVGSFSIGFMIKYIDYKWTCLVLTSGVVLNVLLIVAFLPETIDRTKTKFSSKHPGVFSQLKTAISFYTDPHPNGHRWRYNVCIVAFLFSTFAVFGRSSVETLVQLSRPFCWDSLKVSYFTTIRGLAQNIVAMGGIKLMHMCLDDVSIAVLGCLSGISSLVLEAFVVNDLMFYFVPVVGIGSIITMPMIRSIMSRMTPIDKQGAVFAGIASMEAIGNVVSNLTSSVVFSNTVGIMRGFVFLVLAGFILLCLILVASLKIIPKITKEKELDNVQTVSVPEPTKH